MIGVERVYVVRRADLFPDGAPHGFAPGVEAYLPVIRDKGFFVERPLAEDDPSLKQIIPYAVLRSGEEVFLFQRRKGGGEKRLHGLRSVGVGGHLNPVDGSGTDLVDGGLRRELAEEVGLDACPPYRFAGILNNDEDPVGRVHAGLVAVVDLGAGKDGVEVCEPDTMAGRFVAQRDLLALHARERDSFEGWSALLLDRFDEVLAWERRPGSSTTTPSTTPTSTT